MSAPDYAELVEQTYREMLDDIADLSPGMFRSADERSIRMRAGAHLAHLTMRLRKMPVAIPRER